MMTTIGVGVIGTGVRGRHALEQYLARCRNMEIRAVAWFPSSAPELQDGAGRGESYARRYAGEVGADYAGDDWRQLLARDDISVVSLMIEPDRTLPVASEAIAAGKHIVFDKPMTKSIADAEQLCGLLDRAGIRHIINFWPRFLPAFMKLKETIDSGQIGDVVALDVDWFVGHGPLAGFTASRAYKDVYGGGEVTTHGCYAIDLLNWLAGEPASVDGSVASCFYEDYGKVGMESLGTGTIRYRNGAIGHFATGRIPSKSGIPIFRATVTGEYGTAAADASQAYVDVYCGDGHRKEAFVVDPSQQLASAFVASLQREGDRNAHLPGASDALRVSKVLCGLYEAAQTGRTIPV